MTSMTSPTMSLTMCQSSICRSVTSLRVCPCGQVAYCTKSCQLEDWARHKQDCPMVVLREVEESGKGLVAVRNISAGTIIIKEDPLIACKMAKKLSLVPLAEFEEFKKIKPVEMEELMKLHDPQNLDPMMTDNLDCPDYLRFCRIFAANGITIGKIVHSSVDQEHLTGVYKHFSRINHSCNPSTVVEWEKESLRMEVRAVRMIKKGEELTGNYMGDLVGTRKERLAMLEMNWYFQCGCEVCSLTGKERKMNDKVRKFIVRQLEKLDPDLIRKTNLSTMLIEYLEVLSACYTIETEAIVELPMLLCQCHMIYQAVKLMKVKWICPDHLRKTFMERLGENFLDVLGREAMAVAEVLGRSMVEEVRKMLE